MTRSSRTPRLLASRPTLPAFSLVELLAVMVVLGLIAGVAAPLTVNASDAYSRATSQRAALERAAFTLDRAMALLRNGPETAPGSNAPAITTATPTRVEFADGRRLELLGAVLWATDPSQPVGAAPLCSGVTSFALRYFGADGVTDTAASPEATARIELTLQTGGVSLTTTTLVRCAGVAP